MDTTCYFISIDLSLTRDSAESQFYALTTNNYPMIADTPDRRNNSAKNMAQFLE